MRDVAHPPFAIPDASLPANRTFGFDHTFTDVEAMGASMLLRPATPSGLAVWPRADRYQLAQIRCHVPFFRLCLPHAGEPVPDPSALRPRTVRLSSRRFPSAAREAAGSCD